MVGEELLRLSASIVEAQARQRSMSAQETVEFLRTVHSTMLELSGGAPGASVAPGPVEQPRPAMEPPVTAPATVVSAPEAPPAAASAKPEPVLQEVPEAPVESAPAPEPAKPRKSAKAAKTEPTPKEPEKDLPSWAKKLRTPRTDQEPAVPILESVAPDRIVCLEDGREFQMLTRALKASYKMTPEEYRAKWGLPSDYPMIAENARAKKSAIATDIGLGKHDRGKKGDDARAA